MSIAPSSSTSHEMDEDLCLFFLHDLDIAPSFVNAIDPVICIMQNLSNLYDIGQMDLLDLMHWCMKSPQGLTLMNLGLRQIWIVSTVFTFSFNT